MTTLTVRIPNDIRRELSTLSKQDHIPVSTLVRDSLEKYIARRRFRQLRNKMLPFAEAQGLLTDEDVFNTMS